MRDRGIAAAVPRSAQMNLRLGKRVKRSADAGLEAVRRGVQSVERQEPEHVPGSSPSSRSHGYLDRDGCAKPRLHEADEVRGRHPGTGEQRVGQIGVPLHVLISYQLPASSFPLGGWQLEAGSYRGPGCNSPAFLVDASEQLRRGSLSGESRRGFFQHLSINLRRLRQADHSAGRRFRDSAAPRESQARSPVRV